MHIVVEISCTMVKAAFWEGDVVYSLRADAMVGPLLQGRVPGSSEVLESRCVYIKHACARAGCSADAVGTAVRSLLPTALEYENRRHTI